MSGKKLLALLIAPVFAIGMTACQVDDEPDIFIEETQVPAEEPVIIEETEPQDTLIVPDEPIEDDDPYNPSY